MPNQEHLYAIKKEVEKFFQKMGFEVDLDVQAGPETSFNIKIKSEEPQILIGEGGQTLFEIQRLLKIILKKRLKDNIYIDFDVNDYKKKKLEYLRELARSAADEVSLIKKEKALEPMSPYERRIIHLELAENPNVSTESAGEEPRRYVIIKPQSENGVEKQSISN